MEQTGWTAARTGHIIPPLPRPPSGPLLRLTWRMLCLCRRRAFRSLQLLPERSDLGLELLHLCLRFLQEPLMRKVLLPRSQAL